MNVLNTLPKKMNNETLKSDFDYLDKRNNRDTFKIQTWFDVYKDNWSPGNVIKVRVSNIYDPSKFWIVTRYRELEAFQMYLFNFYNISYENYRIPNEEIRVDLYCIAFVDNGYYRGIIVSCPPPNTKPAKVRLFCIDFGFIVMVSEDFLYYMDDHNKALPQFAVRATLAKMCPSNASTWTKLHVKRFEELVLNKILISLIINIDCDREILEIHLAEVNYTNNNLLQIHKILLTEKLAETACVKETPDNNQLAVKYLYLFPSFELLESGKVPSEVGHSEFLMKIYPPHVLYNNYYN